jgi:hypothetical protein
VAERIVNVVINYKVNTAEVQRAQAISVQAQKATDDLRKTTEAYGRASVTANKQTVDSTKQSINAFNELYTTVKLIATAGLAREFITLNLEMAKLAGNVEGVNRAFSRLPNSTLLLESLRRATHGAVTDLTLMQQTLMAQNFRIPLQKLGTLLEFAAVKAQQTGQEVNHLINYIVSGIGYRSIKRLDDLGFTANRVKEALGGVSLQAASMGEVMDAVSKLMNEDLEKTGGLVHTTKTEVEQLERAWHELGVEVSKQGTSSGMLGLLKDATNAMKAFVMAFPSKEFKEIFSFSSISPAVFFKQLTDFLSAWQVNLNKVVSEQTTLNKALDEAVGIQKKIDQEKTVEKRLQLVENEIDKRKESIEWFDRELKNNAEAYEQIRANNPWDEQLEQIGKTNNSLIHNKNLLKEVIRILEEYKKSLTEPLPGDTSAEKDEEKLVTDPTRFFDNGKKASELQKSLRRQFEELIKQTDQKTGESIPVPVAVSPKPFIPKDDMDKLEEWWLDNWRSVLQQGIDTTANFLIEIEAAEIGHLERLLQMRRDFYDEQILLAGDNERAKKQLRIEEERETQKLQQQIAEREWKVRRNAILIDTAAGIAKNIASYPWPTWIIPAAMSAAQGAAQLAVADRNKPRFAKGVLNLQGPGTETSDSIPAYLSKGESVMTAEETRSSLGVLKLIKANKINDEILKNIDFSGGRINQTVTLDDGRIVDKLDKLIKSNYSIERQGRILYKSFVDGEGNKKKVISKVL